MRCTPVCAAVLLSADDIRILATSPVSRLGLPEEARYRLPPLALAGPDGPDGSGLGPRRRR